MAMKARHILKMCMYINYFPDNKRVYKYTEDAH